MSSPRKKPVLMAWSGGKDSALALAALRRSRQWNVVGLLTTVTERYRRVSMHGVREELLARQAHAIGLPLTKVRLPVGASMEGYESRMRRALERWVRRGVVAVAFGDIFLADVRAYREARLSEVGLKALFPLWGLETGRLARRFTRAGFRAIVTCVDGSVLDGAMAGREFGRDFIRDLPPGVDPCGENGEFHSFVYDGNIFRCPVAFRTGRRVLREGRFWYFDLTCRA